MRFKSNTHAQRRFEDFDSLPNSIFKKSQYDFENRFIFIVNRYRFATNKKTIKIANDERKNLLKLI